MEIPEDWVTEKRTLNVFKDDYRDAQLAFDKEECKIIGGEWQKAARQYQQFHRLLKVYKGGIKFNPRIHIGPLFEDKRNAPFIKRGE